MKQNFNQILYELTINVYTRPIFGQVISYNFVSNKWNVYFINVDLMIYTLCFTVLMAMTQALLSKWCFLFSNTVKPIQHQANCPYLYYQSLVFVSLSGSSSCGLFMKHAEILLVKRLLILIFDIDNTYIIKSIPYYS